MLAKLQVDNFTKKTMNNLIKDLLEGNNYPSEGYISFDSSDHIRLLICLPDVVVFH